jgi:hypothetical protein
MRARSPRPASTAATTMADTVPVLELVRMVAWQ